MMGWTKKDTSPFRGSAEKYQGLVRPNYRFNARGKSWCGRKRIPSFPPSSLLPQFERLAENPPNGACGMQRRGKERSKVALSLLSGRSNR